MKRLSRRAVLAGGIAAVLPARKSLAAAEPIRIGWLSSLTGPLSSAAIAENQGVQFAIEQINATGGIDGRRFELLTRDTAGDPTKAVNFAQQLAFSEKVHAIIGPVNSGESLATVPIVARAGIPNIIIGTVSELTNPEKYPRAFRAINTNEQWVRRGNAFAVENLGKKKIALIGDTTGYGTMTAKQATSLLEKSGIKPVYSVLIDPNKADVTDEMTKARNSGADVIAPWTAATGLLARILNARGDMTWDIPVVGHPALMGLPIKGLLNKADYWENAFSVGYKSATFRPDGTLPERTQALMDAIRPKLGGGAIDFTFWWVALGYDTVKIIEHAIRTSGSTDSAQIQKALEATKELMGVYADYSWGPDVRDGFPDSGIVINRANTFRDGSFQPA